MNPENTLSLIDEAVMTSLKKTVLSQWQSIAPVPPSFSKGTYSKSGQLKYYLANYNKLGVTNPYTPTP